MCSGHCKAAGLTGMNARLRMALKRRVDNCLEGKCQKWIDANPDTVAKWLEGTGAA